MKSAQNYLINGNRLNCNGCRIQAKQMEIIWTMYNMKPVELSGTKEEISERRNERA
jgi:hypothetical protein